MKNKEFYKEQIFDIACQGTAIAIEKKTNAPIPCRAACQNCIFGYSEGDCSNLIEKWCNEEYVPKLTKEEMTFLCILSKKYKYIESSFFSNCFCVSTTYLSEDRTYESFNKNDFENVRFDFIQDEPWSIEDLMKLEVIE